MRGSSTRLRASSPAAATPRSRRAIAREAEISLRTLYEHFDSVDHAFQAALRVGTETGLEIAGAAASAEHQAPRGLVAASIAATRFLAAERDFATMALVAAAGAGDLGLAEQLRAQAAIARYLSSAF